MKYRVTIGDHVHEVEVAGAEVLVDGTRVGAELSAANGLPIRHLLADHRSYRLIARPGVRPGSWQLTLNGRTVAVEALDERTRSIREMEGAEVLVSARVLSAPMPGLVVRVNVQPGQEVAAGQSVVVVEAMKMENELRAPAPGTVARVEVVPGQAVEKGAKLIVFE